MANYKSRYTGEQVDNAIGSLQSLDNSGIGVVKIDAEGNLSAESLTNLKTDLAYTPEDINAIAENKIGAANGVVPLNSLSKIDSTYLPSYVDDVLEYTSASSFPQEGEAGKIYVDLSDNKTYRWGGSTYVEISPSTVVTVNPTLVAGVKSATITVNGTSYDIYSTTDTHLSTSARGTTKAYVLGTTTTPASSAQAITGVAETDVYFDTVAGTLVATTFKGALDGTASGNLTANSDLAWNKVINKPTTISGYGITDAKIESGVITIGNNTATVPTKVSQLQNDSQYVTINDITPSSGVFATSVEAIGTTQTTTAGSSDDFVRGNHVHAITKTVIDTVIGANSSDTTKYYRMDGTWVTPPQGTVNAVKINNETKTPVNGVVDLGTISITAVNSLTTTAGAHSAITNQTGNVSLAIPTNTSHLVNDSNFASIQITRW